MADQYNFKSSRLFKMSKTVHPANIVSVFYGYPLPPENEQGLIDLLDFLLGTKIQRNLLTTSLIQTQCKKTIPYLKTCFPELYNFSSQYSAEIAKNKDNPNYIIQFLSQIEFTFGKEIGVIKMEPNHFYHKKTKQKKVGESDPLDCILNAYHPTKIYSMPKFLPPFYVHKDPAQNQEFKTENRAKL